MICGQETLEFLWEETVVHATYLRNRAYKSVLKDMTSYEVWYKVKPNIIHLQEFGAPYLDSLPRETCPM